MKTTRFIIIVSLIILLSFSLTLAWAQTNKIQPKAAIPKKMTAPQLPSNVVEAMKNANTDLDALALELAKLCTQPGFRGFLRSEIAKSKNRENILELDQFLDRASVSVN